MTSDASDLLYASLCRQYLLSKGPCKTVVSELCGLQAQFANNPKYALWIRGSDFDAGRWQEGLVKIWSFRKTLHVVLEEELGLFLSACGVPQAWHSGWNLEGRRMEYWSAFLLDRIRAGVRGREQLKAACREKGMEDQELKQVFHGWGGLIYEMSRRGLIAYHSGTEKKFVLCPAISWMERDRARIALLRRYFRTFGPATIEDYLYFTGYKKREFETMIGCPVKDLRHKPELLGPELRVLSRGEKDYYYTGDLPGGGIPPCLFLTGFDQLLMGYRDRSRVVDDAFKAKVTTATGIVHPTVILRGRLGAAWKKDGDCLNITAFDRISRRDQRLIAETGEAVFGGDLREVRFK
jgi:hypothetical protein